MSGWWAVGSWRRGRSSRGSSCCFGVHVRLGVVCPGSNFLLVQKYLYLFYSSRVQLCVFSLKSKAADEKCISGKNPGWNIHDRGYFYKSKFLRQRILKSYIRTEDDLVYI